MEDCIFCKIVREKPGNLIYENDNFISIPDANPAVEGHSLVIPKNHSDNILDLPNISGSELLDCIKKTSLILIDKFNADGFNVVQNNFKSAGQEVNHIHFHILPRTEGDGLRLRLVDEEGNVAKED